MVRLVLTVFTLLLMAWGLASSSHDYACKSDTDRRASTLEEHQLPTSDYDPCHLGICNFGHCHHLNLPSAWLRMHVMTSFASPEIPYSSEVGKSFLRRLERPPIVGSLRFVRL